MEYYWICIMLSFEKQFNYRDYNKTWHKYLGSPFKHRPEERTMCALICFSFILNFDHWTNIQFCIYLCEFTCLIKETATLWYHNILNTLKATCSSPQTCNQWHRQRGRQRKCHFRSTRLEFWKHNIKKWKLTLSVAITKSNRLLENVFQMKAFCHLCRLLLLMFMPKKFV